MKKILIMAIPVFVLLISGCKGEPEKKTEKSVLQKKVNDFVPFKLQADLSSLTENQKKMIPLMIEAANIMDELFWIEAYGDKNRLLDTLENEWAKKYVRINYGPWERLNNNEPFIEGAGKKPLGANFYPEDMTKEEFNEYGNENKSDLYTLIRRDEKGRLTTIPYHIAFENKIKEAAGLIKQAAVLAEDEGFKKYLELRAEALLTDEYFESDMAWMDMRNNKIDFVVGPIETYEDRLFGYKAAHEAYILIKDTDWSKRLDRYSALLPGLQKGLPVDEKYKTETPGSDSDLGVYEAIYYAGDCNAGSKTIAINLPNDPKVHLSIGSRKLQLKNSMQAKFEKILIPIADELIHEDQRKHITFNAFFANTMFHEVAHGMGIKNTVTGTGTVREALQDHASAIEEGKADILGLYLVTKLREMGEIDADLMDNYTTFLAGIFRSIRFGASSAHGQANLVRFNYFKEKGAFTVNSDTTFSVNFDKMQEAMNELCEIILVTQGEGDYEQSDSLMKTYGKIDDDLRQALNRINSENIPVDIVFKQGLEVLGL